MPLLDHVSLDIETLGRSADCYILSVGAVKFSPETGEMNDEAFYAQISLESNAAWGRKIDADTLRWWMGQSQEARMKLFREDPQHKPEVVGGTLEQALNDMIAWMNDLKHPNKYKVWGNGADFDQPFMQHAFIAAGTQAPWMFWDNRCLRTLKNLPFARDVKVERVGVHHNALDDAIHQAKVVSAIWQKMLKLK